MARQHAPLPLILEDQSGSPTDSHFDDVYDRLFLRIAEQPASPASGADKTIMIYNMGQRWSRRRDYLHVHCSPSVLLAFGAGGGLGTVTFMHAQASQPPVALQISKYLKKTSVFSGPLSRKFRASDGQEYKWCHRAVDGHEWVCVGMTHNYIIAHYDLKPPDKPGYGKSGNVLTIESQFASLAIELMATFTIMRCLAKQQNV